MESKAERSGYEEEERSERRGGGMRWSTSVVVFTSPDDHRGEAEAKRRAGTGVVGGGREDACIDS